MKIYSYNRSIIKKTLIIYFHLTLVIQCLSHDECQTISLDMGVLLAIFKNFITTIFKVFLKVEPNCNLFKD